MPQLFLIVMAALLAKSGCNPDAASPSSSGSKNGVIAFTRRDMNGRLQIFTIQPNGTNIRQLTFGEDSGRPDWSPDGRHIAFMTFRNEKAWIAVMDANGSNQTMLAEGITPDWSPDGRLIAFARPDEGQVLQIWTIHADGSNMTQITRSNTTKIGPSWSPRGDEMVFILLKNPGSPSDPQPEIGIMNADGTNERILTTEDRINIHVDLNGDTTLCETAYDANAPAWSPVSNTIAFWSGVENQYGQIWTINSDGSGSRQLTDDCNRNSDDPSWSPDGRKILFGSLRSGRPELWMMDTDGGNKQKITFIDAGPFPGRAVWQPRQ